MEEICIMRTVLTCILARFYWIIKSKKTTLAGNVARRGRREMYTGFSLVHLILFGRPKRIRKNNIKIDLKKKKVDLR
jgi:hypothetical protein